MYIGTSLGRCMVDILRGNVEEDRVALIITGTMAPTYDRYIDIVKQYYEEGNWRASGDYYLGQFEWDKVLALAESLWNHGKIHQPRNFGWNNSSLVNHAGGDIWLEIVPTLNTSNQSVVDAYEKYRILAALVK